MNGCFSCGIEEPKGSISHNWCECPCHDSRQPVEGLCVCGHEPHEDEDCPEQVRIGGQLRPCGCDDFVPSRFDTTARGGVQ